VSLICPFFRAKKCTVMLSLPWSQMRPFPGYMNGCRLF